MYHRLPLGAQGMHKGNIIQHYGEQGHRVSRAAERMEPVL